MTTTTPTPHETTVRLDAPTDRYGIHLILSTGPLVTCHLEPPVHACGWVGGPDQWWEPPAIPFLDEAGRVDPDRTADALILVPASGILPPGASLAGTLTSWEADAHARSWLTWGDLRSRVPDGALAVAVVTPAVQMEDEYHDLYVGYARPVVVAWYTAADLGLALACYARP